MAPAIPHLPRIQRALLAWHVREGMLAPWRESGDPYEALVAAVMAQQTQMSRVMVSYERFMAAFPTIDVLSAASVGDVIRVWKGMGYNQRAVRLHRAARTITGSGWPREAAALAEIDGIGPFTAAIIASFAFGQPAACVDTNVVRVLSRLTGDESLRGNRLQNLADASMTGIAAKQPARWNQALMDYGARVCGVRPKCGACVVSAWCASRGRFAGDATADARPALALVADEKMPYRAERLKFEHTPRYFRGRIIDALRELPPGRSLPLADLPVRIANEVTPTGSEIETWVVALEKAGLVTRDGGRVMLPA